MKRVEEQIAREAVFGILPVLPGERRYGFLDAFLVLSGYCIATWSLYGHLASLPDRYSCIATVGPTTYCSRIIP